MKKIFFTFFVSILASYVIASDETGLKEFKREVRREFSIGANAGLRVENKFGNIRIVEGTENKISFVIEITGKGQTDALAKELAEAISIEFAQRGDQVTAETVMRNINCNNCGRNTNYTIVAPKSVTLNLVNKFGNIHVENVIKPMNVNLEFGDLEANSLADVTIENKHGNITINTCNDLKLNCSFSKIKIGKSNRMKVESKHDGFQIGTITDLDIKTSFTTIRIDNLEDSFVGAEFNHGTLDISNISPRFSRIKVDSNFSTIKLGLDNRHSFKANIHTQFSGIHTGSLTMNNFKSQRNSIEFSGTMGSATNPSAIVDISAKHGNINFK
ncbi:MAG: hypothetical protein LBE79_05820 [Tannerella sp.]|jgi:hypothetical protein|nr:hypothetical protein [Tannerella sp.]